MFWYIWYLVLLYVRQKYKVHKKDMIWEINFLLVETFTYLLDLCMKIVPKKIPLTHESA